MNPTIIKVSNKLEVSNLPNEVIEELKSILIIENPLWIENVKYGYSNFKTPRLLTFIHNNGSGSYIIPRGYITRLTDRLKAQSINYKVIDNTISLPRLQLKFLGTLKDDFQKPACMEILKRRFGVLQSPTGSGKTVMALYIIAARQQPTLIIVHTKELMYQWKKRILSFLDIAENNIGLVGDGHNYRGNITIAIINSLYRIVEGVAPSVGFLIVDECHRVPGRVFSGAVVHFPSKFMLGLSATPYRRDKLTNVMHFYIGETVHIINTKELVEKGHIMKASLKVIKTEFKYHIKVDEDGNLITTFPEIVSALIKSKKRNRLIIRHILKQIKEDTGIALVISDRKAHCHKIYNRLIRRGAKAVLVIGNTPTKERQQIINSMNSEQVEVVVATGQLIGEGFDQEKISSIFLTTPIKWEGRVIQYIGRMLRICEGKTKATIYDFSDKPWLLQHSLRKRLITYKEELGINIKEKVK